MRQGSVWRRRRAVSSWSQPPGGGSRLDGGALRRVAVAARDDVIGALAVVLGQEAGLHAEVVRVGVVRDDRHGRLLGLECEAAAQAQADLRRVDQAEELLVLG